MKKYLQNNLGKQHRFKMLPWVVGSIAYTLILFINQHFALIELLGFSTKTESIIKIVGVLGYMLFTAFNVHKDPTYETPRTTRTSHHSKHRKSL